MSNMTRRDALSRMSLATVGLAAMPVRGWPEAWFIQEAVIPFTDVPADFTGIRAGAEQFPGQNRSAQDLRRLESWVTPVEDFFVVAHYGIAEVDARTYRLSVGGLVRRSIDLSLEHRGIHGTPEPAAVGKTQSHGCIRLTNWDAVELGAAVKAGMPAVLQE